MIRLVREAHQAATQAGHYTATITFPSAGDWTVRFASITPRATLQQPQTIQASATTTSTTTSTPATTTTLPSLDLRPSNSDKDSSDGPGLLAAAIVATVVVAVSAYIFVRRRR